VHAHNVTDFGFVTEDAVVERERLSELNDAPERGGDYVLYWMQQSQRAVCNPALETALAAANRLRRPLLVAFALDDSLPNGKARHFAFMLEGLAETARALAARDIGFVIRRGAAPEVILRLAQRAALLVCDCGYLRRQQSWRAQVAREVGCRMLMVEGDVVVPTRLASGTAEVGARTLRPKLARWCDSFLRPLRRGRPLIGGRSLGVQGDVALEDVPALLARLRVDQRIAPVPGFRGGYPEARRRLRRFVTQHLRRYRDARALPGDPHTSTLSPYLHFGQISPVEVALAVRAAAAAGAARASFLEELIVRRELAVNFVATTPQYASYECLPTWARRTLDRHRGDPRARLYDFEQLAAGATHDPYWNAAMCEMRTTGYMHNHMRMYWGKKVLEWSPTPEAGYATLLQLNNSYFLDGRDASSYANVGWVFGLHDRPWPERPIFGQVRYMNAAGLERKTDVERYVRRWQRTEG
jgi:deoxyribodipyrimidine photo-lyase